MKTSTILSKVDNAAIKLLDGLFDLTVIAAEKTTKNRFKTGLALGLVAGSIATVAIGNALTKWNEYSARPEVKAASERFQGWQRFNRDLISVEHLGDTYINSAVQYRIAGSMTDASNYIQKAKGVYEIARKMCATNDFATPAQRGEIEGTLRNLRNYPN